MALIDRQLTPEKQSIRLKKARSDREETMGQIIRFYVPFLAKELGVFINLGNGYFRNQTEVDVSEDDLADAAVEAGDEVAEDFEGHIYAFSFPSIIRDGVHPIKVGKTAGDVDTRIAEQCKGAATFEQGNRVKEQTPNPLCLLCHSLDASDSHDAKFGRMHNL